MMGHFYPLRVVMSRAKFCKDFCAASHFIEFTPSPSPPARLVGRSAAKISGLCAIDWWCLEHPLPQTQFQHLKDCVKNASQLLNKHPWRSSADSKRGQGERATSRIVKLSRQMSAFSTVITRRAKNVKNYQEVSKTILDTSRRTYTRTPNFLARFGGPQEVIVSC